MVGYIGILLLIVGGGMFIPKLSTNQRNKKIYMLLVFGAMLLFALLRGENVGIDHANRYRTVRLLAGYDWKTFWQYLSLQTEEYGYKIAIWLMTRVFPSPYFVGLVWDTFIITTFGIFFYRYSEDIVVTSLMYAAFVFSAEMNITRQYIAAAIFLWVIHAILKKKYWRSVILIVIAMLFHSSALILFGAYILMAFRYRMTKKIFVVTVLVAVGGFLAFDSISQWFVTIFPQYENYLRGSWAVGDVSFSVLWLCIYSTLAILAMVCLPKHAYDYDRSMGDDDQAYKMQSLVTFFFILYATTSLLTSKIWFVSRMNVYFIFAYCMIIPIVINRLKFIEKNTMRFFRGAFILGLSAWAVLMFRQNGHGILPYEFFWN